MQCDHDRIWIRFEKVYNTAYLVLVRKGLDGTVIDVGCGSAPKLHEMKRHLIKHGINLHTIGIDVHYWDAEVDEFMNADVRDVCMEDAADAVICAGMLGMLTDGESFASVVRACARLLKYDGLMFMDTLRCPTWKDRLLRRHPGFAVKIMSRERAVAHAESCFGVCPDKCPHGFEIPE